MAVSICIRHLFLPFCLSHPCSASFWSSVLIQNFGPSTEHRTALMFVYSITLPKFEYASCFLNIPGTLGTLAHLTADSLSIFGLDKRKIGMLAIVFFFRQHETGFTSEYENIPRSMGSGPFSRSVIPPVPLVRPRAGFLTPIFNRIIFFPTVISGSPGTQK